MMVTGVALKPSFRSSWRAAGSVRMFLSTKDTPLRERNSFSCSQLPHPGWLYTMICSAMISSMPATAGVAPPSWQNVPKECRLRSRSVGSSPQIQMRRLNQPSRNCGARAVPMLIPREFYPFGRYLSNSANRDSGPPGSVRQGRRYTRHHGRRATGKRSQRPGGAGHPPYTGEDACRRWLPPPGLTGQTPDQSDS